MCNLYKKFIFDLDKLRLKTISASTFFALALTGCAVDPITLGALTGSYDQSFELMKGTGNTIRTPDGKIKFTFVIHESATSYFDKNDETGKENFRIHQLGSYLSTVTDCSNGYEVIKLTARVTDTHVYEGACK